MFRQEIGFSLLIAQSSKSFGFSRKFFFEMFRWTRKMPIWGTWSFLASHIFPGKTIKGFKVVSSPRKKNFQNAPLITKIPVWTPLSKSFAKTPEILPSQSTNRVKLIFFSKVKSFVPECFCGHRECENDNTAKTVLPRNRHFLAHCPKVEMFWFQPKFFPRNVPLDTWNAYLRNLEFSCNSQFPRKNHEMI